MDPPDRKTNWKKEPGEVELHWFSHSSVLTGRCFNGMVFSADQHVRKVVLISITADIGIIGYVDDCVPSPAYINQHIALVRFDAGQLCGKFVAYFLASEKSQRLFRASTDTGTKAGMSLIGIQKIELMLPAPAEQQRIAECLTSLDELIAAETRKLEVLKTHKKGLMQQLFPSPEEVKA